MHVSLHKFYISFLNSQLHSDWVWGMCVDAILKWHMAFDAPVYMYEFAHRSEFEYLPYWMGEHKFRPSNQVVSLSLE